MTKYVTNTGTRRVSFFHVSGVAPLYEYLHVACTGISARRHASNGAAVVLGVVMLYSSSTRRYKFVRTPAVSASAALLMISALPISAAANSTRNSSSMFHAAEPSESSNPRL